LVLQIAACAMPADDGPLSSGTAGSQSTSKGSGGDRAGTAGNDNEPGGSSFGSGGSAVGGESGAGGGSAGAPGSGGQSDAGGAGNLRPDGGSSRDAAPVGQEGGPPPNPALDQACTPNIVFDNQFPNTTGGKRFDAAVPDPTATMQDISQRICRWIYRKPEEVPRVPTLSLTIDAADGVAYTSGSGIHFSSTYIGGIGGNDAAISFEIHGVLAHEGTHVWQYDNGGGNLVEAMADYVRYRSGYDKLSRRQRGGNWSDPYTTGGFFIAWVEDKYDKDWGYKINMGMKNPGFSYPNFIQQTFGKSADALWAEYQADIK
jgi:hypothetical protein